MTSTNSSGGPATDAADRTPADVTVPATTQAAEAPGTGQSVDAQQTLVKIPAQTRPAHRVGGAGWAWLSPGTVAVVTFLLGTPVAYALAHFGGSGTSGGPRTWSLPIAACLFGGVILGFAALRQLRPWVTGATAGLAGAWAVLAMSTIFRGTPFPPFGLLGDAGRLTALATRYSVTPFSSDAWVPGSPGDYPPLFPWAVGRISALTGVEAWKLVGRAEFIVTGAAIVVGFLLWRRIVSDWAALLITLAMFSTMASPQKAYEVIALVALIPWLLSTAVRPPQGRMHWLPAGIIAGLIFLSYYGWLIFGIIGVAAIVVMAWRSEPNRRAYALYLLKMLAVAVVISSWYLVPYVGASLRGSDSLGDLNGSGGSFDDMFTFLNFSIPGVLALVGLVGLLVLVRTAWWAKPLLALAVGAFLYRVLAVAGLVLTNHSQLSQYAGRLVNGVLWVAGVLVLVHAVPRLAQRFSWTVPRNLIAVGLAVLLGYIGLSFTNLYLPTGPLGNYTVRAYGEPYPDGHYLAADPAQRTDWFPVAPIQQAVEAVYGPDVRRVSLSVDDRLYAYLPWPGYLSTDRIGMFVKWDQRYAELQKLASIKDPATFATASANTAFGAIDIFILKAEGGSWNFSAALGYNGGTGTVSFQPEQFDQAHWVVRTDLPEDIVVAVRR
jgi:xanthosine utilization system XapX-like protein